MTSLLRLDLWGRIPMVSYATVRMFAPEIQKKRDGERKAILQSELQGEMARKGEAAEMRAAATRAGLHDAEERIHRIEQNISAVQREIARSP